MTTERAPLHEEPMIDDQPGTTPWALARKRLANPEPSRTSWLATVRPDGRPHLMPISAFWIDGAFHFIVGEGTRKGRNLAADGRCVIAIGSTTLPSLDVIVEGHAAPTAGPPPYAIYRMVPSKAFGLPGMLGMEQFERGELPKPTRWAFDGS